MSHCRRERDDEGNWFWIPGCIARANNERDCTCDPRKGSNRDLAVRVTDLEHRFESVCRLVHKLQSKVAQSTTLGQTE